MDSRFDTHAGHWTGTLSFGQYSSSLWTPVNPIVRRVQLHNRGLACSTTRIQYQIEESVSKDVVTFLSTTSCQVLEGGSSFLLQRLASVF
jgi:hypothetical protein